MLKPEVVEAVSNRQFNVWAVTRVDEAIELLTGMPAGERQPDGTFARESVHGRVAARLASFAEALRRSAHPPRPHRPRTAVVGNGAVAHEAGRRGTRG
jgi:hypothetical protein